MIKKYCSSLRQYFTGLYRRFWGAILLLICSFCPTILLAQTPANPWGVNMPVGVTAISREVYGLHMLIFWVCVAIGAVVFSIMFYSILVHRKSLGAKAATFTENTTLEIVWTALATLILVVLAVPSTISLMRIYNTQEATMEILITGYQWKWKYDYLDDDVSFFSNLLTPNEEIEGKVDKGEFYLLDVNEPVVIPVGRKVRFLITAADVLHSWWIPDLAIKQDAIPGFINEAWTIVDKPGIYRGQCAELCGKDHGFMPIVLDARPEAEFQQWLETKKEEQARIRALTASTFSLDELMAMGEKVYTTNCSSCHLEDGAGVPGVFPGLKNSPSVTGDLNEHLEVVINGKAGTAMAAFGAQLNEIDLAAVITYERNAWGNDTGDVVQPIDVARYAE